MRLYVYRYWSAFLLTNSLVVNTFYKEGAGQCLYGKRRISQAAVHCAAHARGILALSAVGAAILSAVGNDFMLCGLISHS